MAKDKKSILFAILILALAIRLYSLNYGLPYVVGPDETRQILDALNMGARFNFIPGDFAYGALHKYFLFLLYAVYFVVGRLAGIFSDRLDFAFKFLSEPYSFYLFARLLSAILGSAVVFIVYKIGRGFYNENVGIIASIFAAINFHLVQLSYWTSSDIVLVFFTSLAFFFIFRLIKEAGLKNLIGASLCTGLAISVKWQGILLIIPLGILLAIKFCKEQPRPKMLLLSLVLVFLSSLIGNMQYLVRADGAFGKLREILQASQFGISSAPLFNHNIIKSSLWYFKELGRQNGMMGILFCVTTIYTMIRIRRLENIVFAAFLFTFLLLFSRGALRYVYYGALILPVFAVLAAKFIDDMYSRSRIEKIFTGLITGVIIIYALTDDLYACFKRSNLDTRQLAKSWMENNIPKGAGIAIDWYELSVPLESSIPFMMRTGNAIRFYETIVPNEIRLRFKEFVARKRIYYNLVPVIHQREDNIWPLDMPQDVIREAEEFEYVKNLYRHFNFLSMGELSEKGIRYLVISSYSYSHFLLDNDPHKTELFNPYLKENTLINNRHLEEYRYITKGSFLFYLAKRARDFYLPLLNSQNKRAVLLKEFRPTGINLGPVIKIYKID